jgi:site-specific DNA-methyltransferase (adenine-specific)
MPLLFDVLKDNSPLYMFCGSDKVDFFKQEVEKYFTVKNLIVWDKGNHTAGDLEAQYGKRYEFIIYANKGRAKFNDDVPRYEDIWQFARVTGKEQIHQNQKPTDLLSRIILQHTSPRALILDPFAGSCATAVSAYRLQRDFIGFEIDDDYYKSGTEWLAAVRSQISIFDL